ncbi:MAG: PilZ domain-containing protein [Desulfotalea sp.]
MNSNIITDIKNNRLNLAFRGIIAKKELAELYTEVRFGVADLQDGFNVISDFSECRLMFLNGLPTFRKIFQYILSKKSGEIVRVVDPKRIITKQILNASLLKRGYKPIYASTIEEAEEKITKHANRDGLRFELHKQSAEILHDDKKHDGHLLNLSTSGCAITSTSLQPNQGDELEVKFAFAGKSSSDVFNLNGKVVRAESDSFSMNFAVLDSQKKTLLWRHLVDESDGEVR